MNSFILSILPMENSMEQFKKEDSLELSLSQTNLGIGLILIRPKKQILLSMIVWA